MPRQIRDLSGEQFGRLTVISRAYYIDTEDYCKRKPKKTKYSRPIWLCVCECGKEVEKSSAQLEGNRCRSCGCLAEEHLADMSKQRELKTIHPGDKYNKLTVLHRLPNKDSHGMWMCRCECGNLKAVRSHSITSGAVKSCGCLRVEHFKKIQQNYNNLSKEEKARCRDDKRKRRQKEEERRAAEKQSELGHAI